MFKRATSIIIVEDVLQETKYMMNLRDICKSNYKYDFILKYPNGNDKEEINLYEFYTKEMRNGTSRLFDKIERIIPNVTITVDDDTFKECFTNKNYTVKVNYSDLKVSPEDATMLIHWGS
jgi:hypothetical protein